MKKIILLAVSALLVIGAGCLSEKAAVPEKPLLSSSLPLDAGKISKLQFLPHPKSLSPAKAFAYSTICSVVKSGDEEGLEVDFSDIKQLMDGTPVDSENIYGRIYAAPYPYGAWREAFRSEENYIESPLEGGEGIIRASEFLKPEKNVENWSDRGALLVRFELYLKVSEKARRSLGTYDVPVSFMKNKYDDFEKIPSIIDGPYICRTGSGTPTEITIKFETDAVSRPMILLEDGRGFCSGVNKKSHAVKVIGLKADTEYIYKIDLGLIVGKKYKFRTAPEKGKGPVKFAFTGISADNGLYMNYLRQISALVFSEDCRFMIFGGRLSGGHTAYREDLLNGFYCFNQTVARFWHERPVYSLGGGEALLNVYGEAGKPKAQFDFDKWPYETDSSEAVFAEMYPNFENAPSQSDPNRPSYKGNVFSFYYGHLKFICVNNNYWYSSDPQKFGGCPEGYIMDDQLKWILSELKNAEDDPTVKYVFITAHFPLLPDKGETRNDVKAYTFSKGRLIPSGKGLHEVQQELKKAFKESSKLAAVLTSHKRGLILARRICEGTCFFSTSRCVLVINAEEDKVSLVCLGLMGEPGFQIDDLMEAKKKK